MMTRPASLSNPDSARPGRNQREIVGSDGEHAELLIDHVGDQVRPKERLATRAHVP
ncbi:MAG TPA: hypothetical protein VE988_26965 [Gemmataceae bacterium]|nr:hypothetical protein [Gemmataceae bacterium]